MVAIISTKYACATAPSNLPPATIIGSSRNSFVPLSDTYDSPLPEKYSIPAISRIRPITMNGTEAIVPIFRGFFLPVTEV